MEAAKESGHEERAGEGSGWEDLGMFRAQRIYKTADSRARKSSTSQLGGCRVQKNLGNLGDGWGKEIKN